MVYQKKRYKLNVVLVSMFAAVIFACNHFVVEQENLPNIVFFYCDDLGWMDVGYKPKPQGQMHIVIVDNGRSKHLGDMNHWKALKCIRCGACMNPARFIGEVVGTVTAV